MNEQILNENSATADSSHGNSPTGKRTRYPTAPQQPSGTVPATGHHHTPSLAQPTTLTNGLTEIYSGPANLNAGFNPQQFQQDATTQNNIIGLGAINAGLYGMFGPGALPFIPNGTAANEQNSTNSPFLSVHGSPNPQSAGSASSHNAQNTIGNRLAVNSYPNGNFNGAGSPYENSSSPNNFGNQPNFDPNQQFNGLGFGNSPLLGMNLMSPLLGMGLNSPSMPQFGGFSNPGSLMGSPALGGNLSQANMATGRTVYVGNLPSDASVDELLSQVRFGPIENVKILPEKSCAFISFLEPHTAAAFHSDAMLRKIRLHEQDLKIGWGKPSPVPSAVVQAVQQDSASRNVYLGQLDQTVTEQSLRDELSKFGPIDQVKIVRDKNIGFVHFLSISTAIKVVNTLPQQPEYAQRRVSFGKDRCAYVPKNQHQQQQHNLAAAQMGTLAANYNHYSPLVGFNSPDMTSPNLIGGTAADPNAVQGNRTVYLGNLHPDTTAEEICNSIRGGILQQIRYIAEKHICFITFVEPHCALAFYQHASFTGISLHNRRLKLGWGKFSGPTPPGIAMAVQNGASRNVYVGNIENFELYTPTKLRADFEEFGEIELINTLESKQCCFINYTNIANAIKAIEGMKIHPDYQNLKISFGKDRCGGAPRNQQRGYDQNLNHRNRSYRPQNQQNGQHQSQSNSPNPAGNGLGIQTETEETSLSGAGDLVMDETANEIQLDSTPAAESTAAAAAA